MIFTVNRFSIITSYSQEYKERACNSHCCS